MSEFVIVSPQQLKSIIVDAKREGAEEVLKMMETRNNSIHWEKLPNFLSVAQVAKIAGKHRDTIITKIEEGLLQAIKIPNKKYVKYQISKLELKRFLEQKRK